MKIHKTNFFFLIIVGMLISGLFCFVNAETFGYGKTEETPINYSQIPSVNNSDYLDGYDSSYFYPASNPSGFITDGNTGWDNIYGFITSITNIFDQSLNTTDNVTHNQIVATEHFKTSGEYRGKDNFIVTGISLSGADVSGFNQEYSYDTLYDQWYGETSSDYAIVKGEYLNDFYGYGVDEDYWYAVDNWESPFFYLYYKVLITDLNNAVDDWTNSGGGSTPPTASYTQDNFSPIVLNGDTGEATFRGVINALGGFNSRSWVNTFELANVYIGEISEYPSAITRHIMYDGSNGAFSVGLAPVGFDGEDLPDYSFRANYGKVEGFDSYGAAFNTGVSSGAGSFACGSSEATSTNTFAAGNKAKTRYVYSSVFSSNSFDNIGDSQINTYTLNALTSTATAREMGVGYTINQNPSGVGTGQRLIVPANSVFSYRVSLVGIDDSNATNIFNGERIYVVQNDGGTCNIRKSETIGTDYNPDSWGGISSSLVDVSGTDIFQIKVSGKASTTIKWTASVVSTELTN
jgi:hypothetical protein